MILIETEDVCGDVSGIFGGLCISGFRTGVRLKEQNKYVKSDIFWDINLIKQIRTDIGQRYLWDISSFGSGKVWT